MECSQLISNTQQFLAAVTQRDLATLSGLAGQILFGVVRPCQGSQLHTLVKLREELEAARDTVENEIATATTTTTTVDITLQIEELEAEVEAIESVFGKIDDIINGPSGRSSGIQSKCSEFLGNVLRFYEAIR